MNLPKFQTQTTETWTDNRVKFSVSPFDNDVRGQFQTCDDDLTIYALTGNLRDVSVMHPCQLGVRHEKNTTFTKNVLNRLVNMIH